MFLITLQTSAQDYKNIIVSVTPLSEKNKDELTSTIEYEYSGQFFYAKLGASIITTKHNKDYIDIHGGFGFNNYFGYQDTERLSIGVIIGRGTISNVYATTFRFEGGYDIKLTNTIFIGALINYEYRSETEFTTPYNKPYWQFNAGARVTFNLGKI